MRVEMVLMGDERSDEEEGAGGRTMLVKRSPEVTTSTSMWRLLRVSMIICRDLFCSSCCHTTTRVTPIECTERADFNTLTEFIIAGTL